jgi:hypothetical protein
MFAAGVELPVVGIALTGSDWFGCCSGFSPESPDGGMEEAVPLLPGSLAVSFDPHALNAMARTKKIHIETFMNDRFIY